jgi:hypothetical protein
MNDDHIVIGNSGLKKLPFIVLKGGFVDLPNRERMYVPKGFCFDNGSIPKILKWLYDTFGFKFLNYRQKAFLIHDFMYRFKGYQKTRNFLITKVDRAYSDDVMAWYLKRAGNSDKMIRTYFLAVRLLGWLSFGKM